MHVEAGGWAAGSARADGRRILGTGRQASLAMPGGSSGRLPKASRGAARQGAGGGIQTGPSKGSEGWWAGLGRAAQPCLALRAACQAATTTRTRTRHCTSIRFPRTLSCGAFGLRMCPVAASVGASPPSSPPRATVSAAFTSRAAAKPTRCGSPPSSRCAVNERKVLRRPAGAAAARRRQQQQQQQQASPSASTAQTAQLQPNLVSASAAVLLTLQAAVDSSQAPGSVPPAPTTPTGEDVKPIDLTVQVEFTAAEGAATELEAATAGLEAAECPTGPQLVVVGELAPTTRTRCCQAPQEELLRKLNEQWDILVLMEVKMKKMKGSIRHLRLTKAKLREELHEKDQLLAMAVIRKKHGM
ncbi:hypothetical protein J1605_022041 [Eschrichtius robustus]|uniref:Uncharacterized protein n=1 Tax=Eschrichtius robustus TaxID=9764 RepID=A0AB34HFZ8_ESCRO|nr:hypothetical protein J1605_022041 [Eschrichtius robustus]